MHVQPAMLKDRDPDKDVRVSIRFLENITEDYRERDFAVRFWDGSIWGEVDRPRFTLVLNHPGALRSMFTSPSELTLGEAFIYGDFDIEGDMEGAFHLGDFLLTKERSLAEKLSLGSLLMRLPGNATVNHGRAAQLSGDMHSKERDRRAVTFHYDVSNEFYSLWLDRSMVYSCAYFKSPSFSIDKAREAGLHLQKAANRARRPSVGPRLRLGRFDDSRRAKLWCTRIWSHTQRSPGGICA